MFYNAKKFYRLFMLKTYAIIGHQSHGSSVFITEIVPVSYQNQSYPYYLSHKLLNHVLSEYQMGLQQVNQLKTSL